MYQNCRQSFLVYTKPTRICAITNRKILSIKALTSKDNLNILDSLWQGGCPYFNVVLYSQFIHTAFTDLTVMSDTRSFLNKQLAL